MKTKQRRRNMAKTTITFRLSDEEKIELENYADENDLSVS
jgi:hypothetical protein